jgi:hypothetical protein
MATQGRLHQAHRRPGRKGGGDRQYQHRLHTPGRERLEEVHTYIGANTDCIGVREAFRKSIPMVEEEANGRNAMVLGGGGACRAAVYALKRWLGAGTVYFVNRDRQEVERDTSR